MDDVLVRARQYVEVLWAYNQLNQSPRSADLLLVMGTNDLRVPEHAAHLAHQFDYAHIVSSGGVTHEHSKTNELFGGLEATVFATRMISLGIEKDRCVKKMP